VKIQPVNWGRRLVERMSNLVQRIRQRYPGPFSERASDYATVASAAKSPKLGGRRRGELPVWTVGKYRTGQRVHRLRRPDTHRADFAASNANFGRLGGVLSPPTASTPTLNPPTPAAPAPTEPTAPTTDPAVTVSPLSMLFPRAHRAYRGTVPEQPSPARPHVWSTRIDAAA